MESLTIKMEKARKTPLFGASVLLPTSSTTMTLDLSSVTPFKESSLIGTSEMLSRFSAITPNLSTVTPS